METAKDSVSQSLRQHIALWVNALAVGLRHLAQNDPSAPAVLNELGKTIAANAAQCKSPRLETTAMELASAAGETLQRTAQELIELLRTEGIDAVREGRKSEIQPRELTTEQTATSAQEPESHPTSSRAIEAAAPANLMELEEFRSAFDRTLRHCMADNMPATLVLLVIDSANSILASQGPAELERIVLDTASLMAQSFRRTDLLTRCGLSEFLVLLPGEESFGAMRAVQKVMTILSRIPCNCTGEKGSGLVTCSAGIVTLEVETTLDAAMAAARECLREAQAAGGGRVVARDPTRGKQKHRILLVGPNDLTGRVLKGVLEKEGYEVAQTATAAEAGRLVATQVCNLVITYGAVPDGDPAAIAGLVRQVPQHGRVPVLALLADNTPANIVRTLEGGVSDYTTQPFSPQRVLFTVKQLLTKGAKLERPTPQTCRILLIDLDVKNLLLAASAIHHHGGFLVYLALSLPQGIARLDSVEPDMVVFPYEEDQTILNTLADRVLERGGFLVASVPEGVKPLFRGILANAVRGAITRPYTPGRLLEQLDRLWPFGERTNLAVPPLEHLNAEIHRIIEAAASASRPPEMSTP